MAEYVYSWQPQRRKAYQVDLRWNIIFSIVARGRSVIEAAREFGVASTTFFNWWFRFRNSADLSVSLRNHQRIECALDELLVVFLSTLLEHEPTFIPVRNKAAD